MRYGVITIACGLIGTAILNQFINAWPNKKLIGYGYINQIWDILPEVALAGGMGTAVYFVGYLSINGDLLILILQVAVGVLVYFTGSIIFQLESYIYLKGKIKDIFRK